jgi:hypothetical protein
MRTSQKLKKILQENTVGISYGADGWGLTVVSIKGKVGRKNYSGESFSIIVDKAYKNLNKSTLLYDSFSG